MSNYVETRYYDAEGSSNNEYSELVRKITSFNTDSNTGSYINSNIIPYFSLSNFNDTTPSIELNLNEESLSNALKEGTNPSLKTYLQNLEDLKTGNQYLIDNYVIDAAMKIIHYYVASSALYAYIYSQENSQAQDLTIAQENVVGDYVGPNIKLLNHNNNNNNNETATIQKLYDYHKEAVDALKKTDNKYHTHLLLNTDLNSTFQTNNTNLIKKEEIFDTKKAFAITMIAKSHKANKLYSKKQFWFMVYLIIFMVYLFGILGFIFAGGSSYQVFNQFQSGMSGLVIVIINITILVGLFVNEIIKYFRK